MSRSFSGFLPTQKLINYRSRGIVYIQVIVVIFITAIQIKQISVMATTDNIKAAYVNIYALLRCTTSTFISLCHIQEQKIPTFYLTCGKEYKNILLRVSSEYLSMLCYRSVKDKINKVLHTQDQGQIHDYIHCYVSILASYVTYVLNLSNFTGWNSHQSKYFL